MSCAHVHSIRFIKTKFDLLLQDSTAEEVELSTASKVSGKLLNQQMLLNFDLQLRGKRGSDVILRIDGRLEAMYGLPEDQMPSDAQIKAFGRTNGMLNVWPYWREFVQSATMRAGLPPLTLPLFRVIRDNPSHEMKAPRAD